MPHPKEKFTDTIVHTKAYGFRELRWKPESIWILYNHHHDCKQPYGGCRRPSYEGARIYTYTPFTKNFSPLSYTHVLPIHFSQEIFF